MLPTCHAHHYFRYTKNLVVYNCDGQVFRISVDLVFVFIKALHRERNHNKLYYSHQSVALNDATENSKFSKLKLISIYIFCFQTFAGSREHCS